jgi:arachidonate 15-lipoxygenase
MSTTGQAHSTFFSPSLPQNDGFVEQTERKLQLAGTRLIYKYENVTGLPMPLASDAAVVAELLGLEDWVKGQAENQLRIFVNIQIWEILSRFQSAEADFADYADKIAGILESARYKHLASEIRIEDGSLSALQELADRINRFDTSEVPNFPNLASYGKVFEIYETPAITGIWQDDKTFSSQRLAGLNPLALKRVTLSGVIGANWDALKPKLSSEITDEAVQFFLGPDATFASAIEQNRLFVADYEALTRAKADVNAPGAQKGQFLLGPIALFVRTDDFPAPQLAAIQINQPRTTDQASATGSVKFPSMMVSDAAEPGNAFKWIMAKMFLQAADLNINQAVNHLGETHLTEEAFAIAVHRHLASQHPLNILLTKHYTALMVINELGELTLINEMGLVQKILEGGLAGTLELIQNAYAEWNFNDYDFPARLAERGLDSDSLPYFPYRDDGLLIWDTIGNYVAEYVGLYYKTDADVTGDYELQAWANELASASGGHINGFASSINGIKELCTILQRLIWTAGPQHAAVNFPQIDYAAFIPNLPGATYTPPPDDFKTATVNEQDLLNLLPPPDPTGVQFKTTYALAGYHYDKLLDYFDSLDLEPGTVCKKYYDQLQGAVKAQIEQRNAERAAQQGLLPYSYFLPDNIPNSTSV